MPQPWDIYYDLAHRHSMSMTGPLAPLTVSVLDTLIPWRARRRTLLYLTLLLRTHFNLYHHRAVGKTNVINIDLSSSIRAVVIVTCHGARTRLQMDFIDKNNYIRRIGKLLCLNMIVFLLNDKYI